MIMVWAAKDQDDAQAMIYKSEATDAWALFAKEYTGPDAPTIMVDLTRGQLEDLRKCIDIELEAK